MQKLEALLNEKLLNFGNPRFWGKKFYIQIKGGPTAEGILVRMNWTMRYGMINGFLTLKDNASERKIDFDNISDISQTPFIEIPKPAPAVIKKEIPREEIRITIPERKVEKIEKIQKAEVLA